MKTHGLKTLDTRGVNSAMTNCRLSLILVCTTATCALAAEPAGFELHKGEHICIIGDTLAERMQHDGWLETMIQARYPDHQLVFRNLGNSGDEFRVQKAEKWLTTTRADVVFAFFGGTESRAGEAGLPQFKKDLDAMLKHLLGQKYNGKSAPCIVLFSPIAFENLHKLKLPDGVEANQRLKLYTDAMEDVAKANAVEFVDLFTATQRLYADAQKPLTANGVDLTPTGDMLVTSVVMGWLFGEEDVKPSKLVKLRQVVVEKNDCWLQRYHAKGDNPRENEALDVMTSDRDKQIWAIAQTVTQTSRHQSETRTSPAPGRR
jgi:hypothetical protein